MPLARLAAFLAPIALLVLVRAGAGMTHDVEEAVFLADRVVILSKGRVRANPEPAAQVAMRWIPGLKSTFDVNKHVEPGPILEVMQTRPELFADLPAIPASAAITPGWVFRP